MYLLYTVVLLLIAISLDFICYNYILSLNCVIDGKSCDLSKVVFDGLTSNDGGGGRKSFQ
jgi:hypothetical protein